MNDLARHADRLSIGGDPEFFGRPEWIRARDIYRLGAMSTRGMDSTFMYGAVRDGEVDVIGAYTTDGRISAYDLVTLHDPAQAFPPYDAILMLSPEAAESSNLIETLTPLINAIDDELMREANRRVDLDSASPQQAASYLLSRLEK
jgi:osmoprotectant transport system permease protein